ASAAWAIAAPRPREAPVMNQVLLISYSLRWWSVPDCHRRSVAVGRFPGFQIEALGSCCLGSEPGRAGENLACRHVIAHAITGLHSNQMLIAETQHRYFTRLDRA